MPVQLSERYAIARAIEQPQTKLRLEVLHGGKHRGLRPAEFVRPRLESARSSNGFKAPKLKQG